MAKKCFHQKNKVMRNSFYEKLINSLDKIPTVTLDEKNDKADAIIAVTRIIRKRSKKASVKWNGKKWKVSEQ